tara:strand:- start:1736 stop:1915 length:180 start_codon:yes stop_codon:yes gene_type:complete
MSFVELIVILLISFGIFDKSKLLYYYKKILKLQSGQERQIIGDATVEEKWIWIDSNEEE